MADDFKDSLRKAAGIPTTAERVKQIEEAARQQIEWERDAPKREAALTEYRTRVMPLIAECLALAQDVAKKETKPPHEIIEQRAVALGGGRTAPLAQITYYLVIPPPALPHMRGLRPVAQPAKTVGSMHIILHNSGDLSIENPENQRANSPPTRIPVSQVQLSHIQAGFLGLLARLRRQ
jgi:hypothetical protein